MSLKYIQLEGKTSKRKMSHFYIFILVKILMTQWVKLGRGSFLRLQVPVTGWVAKKISSIFVLWKARLAVRLG